MIVCVSGATSRAGKTALAETLLRALAPAAPVAVKFTTTEDVFVRCPRGTPCVVCDIDVPFRIIEDAATLEQHGTDTWRLGRAGARRVVWTIARQAALAPAWEATRARGLAPVAVLEGSTIASVARPDLTLFVAHPFLKPERWKPTSAGLVAAADLVVLNRPSAEPRDPAAEVVTELLRLRGRDDTLVADVTHPLEEWAPAFARRLRAAIGENRGSP